MFFGISSCVVLKCQKSSQFWHFKFPLFCFSQVKPGNMSNVFWITLLTFWSLFNFEQHWLWLHENVIGTPWFVSSFIKTVTNVVECRMMVLYIQFKCKTWMNPLVVGILKNYCLHKSNQLFHNQEIVLAEFMTFLWHSVKIALNGK